MRHWLICWLAFEVPFYRWSPLWLGDLAFKLAWRLGRRPS